MYWLDNICPDCEEDIEVCECDLEERLADLIPKYRDDLAPLLPPPDGHP